MRKTSVLKFEADVKCWIFRPAAPYIDFSLHFLFIGIITENAMKN